MQRHPVGASCRLVDQDVLRFVDRDNGDTIEEFWALSPCNNNSAVPTDNIIQITPLSIVIVLYLTVALPP